MAGAGWTSRRRVLAGLQRAIFRWPTEAIADRAGRHIATWALARSYAWLPQWPWYAPDRADASGHGSAADRRSHDATARDDPPGVGRAGRQSASRQRAMARRDTRLHAVLLGGERLWCAFDQVRKVNGRSVRVPAPAPEPNMRTIEQKDIARWPRSVGLLLGSL